MPRAPLPGIFLSTKDFKDFTTENISDYRMAYQYLPSEERMLQLYKASGYPLLTDRLPVSHEEKLQHYEKMVESENMRAVFGVPQEGSDEILEIFKCRFDNILKICEKPQGEIDVFTKLNLINLRNPKKTDEKKEDFETDIRTNREEKYLCDYVAIAFICLIKKNGTDWKMDIDPKSLKESEDLAMKILDQKKKEVESALADLEKEHFQFSFPDNPFFKDGVDQQKVFKVQKFLKEKKLKEEYENLAVKMGANLSKDDDAYLKLWQHGPWERVLKREFNPESFHIEKPLYYKEAQMRKLKCLEYACEKIAVTEGALLTIFEKEDLKKYSSEYLLDQITNIFINLSSLMEESGRDGIVQSNPIITLIDTFGIYKCHRFVRNRSYVFDDKTKKYMRKEDAWEILSMKPLDNVNFVSDWLLRKKRLDAVLRAINRHYIFETYSDSSATNGYYVPRLLLYQYSKYLKNYWAWDREGLTRMGPIDVIKKLCYDFFDFEYLKPIREN